jgi:hypothetical protein
VTARIRFLPSGSSRGVVGGLCVLIATFTGCLSVAAPTALANAPILSYSAVPGTTQAGGHPDLEVKFTVKSRLAQHSQSPCNCEDAKDALAHLPTGFIGNPHATPQCSIADFSADICPVDSQVGIAHVEATGANFNSALYNLIPPPDVAGLTGFKLAAFDTPQFTVLSARTDSDYGLDATATSIFHGLGVPLDLLQQVLWGVPADPSHNPLRIDPDTNPLQFKGVTWYWSSGLCDASGAASTSDPNTVVQPCGGGFPGAASNSPLTPFLQNPTNCDAPLISSLDLSSYDGGRDHAVYPWPRPTGCDQLSFNPSLYAQPTTTQTDSASGIDVNLGIPQQLSPTIPSPTELRGATVTLPSGFSINPNAADGKTSCSDADANFGSEAAANCPEFSKVGSLEIDSSALPGPVPGFVYLGQPLDGDRYRIFLVADGFATHIKLPGTVTPDPVTGQLVITFTNLPESPLTAFNMHFFGSERGLLATPTHCGSYPVTTTFMPWDSSLGTQTSTQFFTLDSGPNGAPCPGASRPFDPSLVAGVTDNTAGAHSPFLLDLIRNDGDQNLTGVDVTTPPGFSATLAGIPYCSDAALAAAAVSSYSGLAEEANPSCPLASQVGIAATAAGAGTHPLYTPGKVYLSGPYKGAPLSLAVITPAVSGPYDLGNVVVRVALNVDPTDAHITAVSDPLPQILDGIPLRLREVRVNLDRPNFAINPTNCDAFQVGATAFGDQGARADLASNFQVASCTDLGFSPKLALDLSGGTKRTGHPALHSTLTANGTDAGISRAVVTLPPSELLDNAHIQSPCTRVQFAAGACPPGSVLGSAKAETPLIDHPLEGPVYLMTGFGHKLPDLVAVLKGQVKVVLDGRIDTVHGGLRTTFETVPDVPVSKFTLDLLGGNKGLLQNNTNICNARRVAVVKFDGQNGKSADQNVVVGASCGKGRHKRHRRHLARARTVG